MKKNDLIFGGMTFILVGAVGAAAYYGFQNSTNDAARNTAETELAELQKTLEGKQTALSKMSDTNSRLNTELNDTKNALDETAIKLQKMEQMLARGNGVDITDPDRNPSANGSVDMEIAQRNLRDLQRRNDELESFATKVRDQLKASTNEEALSIFEQLVQESGIADSVVGNLADGQAGKNGTGKHDIVGKQLKRPLVRVRNDGQSNGSSRAADENLIAKNGSENVNASDTDVVDLKSPKNSTETSSREEKGQSDVVEADDLVKVTKRPGRTVEARKARENLSEIDLLRLEIIELQEKFDRRERLLREQAELIDQIKPAKSSASYRETGTRVEGKPVIREEADVSNNESFSSGDVRNETQRVYYDPAEFRTEGTVIETIILP